MTNAFSPSLAKVRIEPQAIQIAIIKMFIAMKLLFLCIKQEAFRVFFSIVAPSLNVFSHTTLARDIFKL